MKKGDLDKLLIFDGNETIFSIVGRMESLISLVKSNKKYHGLHPFLETYYYVTKKVVENSIKNKKYFKDFKSLEKLDVRFARYYFGPVSEMIKNTHSGQWKELFDYCDRKDSIPLVKMLVGINIHINSDLFLSLKDEKYDNRRDFIKINKVLESVIPEVIKFLAFEEKDFFAFGGLFLDSLMKEEFRKVIVRWREDAWDNYKKGVNKNQVIRKTRLNSLEIIRIFDNLDLTNINHSVKKINRLRVKL